MYVPTGSSVEYDLITFDPRPSQTSVLGGDLEVFGSLGDLEWVCISPWTTQKLHMDFGAAQHKAVSREGFNGTDKTPAVNSSRSGDDLHAPS